MSIIIGVGTADGRCDAGHSGGGLCHSAELRPREVAAVLCIGSAAALRHQRRQRAAELPRERRLRRLAQQAEELLTARQIRIKSEERWQEMWWHDKIADL